MPWLETHRFVDLVELLLKEAKLLELAESLGDCDVRLEALTHNPLVRLCCLLERLSQFGKQCGRRASLLHMRLGGENGRASSYRGWAIESIPRRDHFAFFKTISPLICFTAPSALDRLSHSSQQHTRLPVRCFIADAG
jgi:hypothetical protein